jgi:hypothetical protein
MADQQNAQPVGQQPVQLVIQLAVQPPQGMNPIANQPGHGNVQVAHA